MLSSVIFDLEPTFEHAHPITGPQAHGWFLSAIRREAPALAEELHGPRQRRRPFTLWVGARFEVDPALGVVTRDHALTWLRATGLDLRVSTVLARLTNPPPSSLRLGGAEFRVSGVAVTPDANSWSGTLGYERLLENWRTKTPSGRVRLRFLSPTTFASHGGRVSWARFPEPDLVFGSLARRWNDLSGFPFDEQIVRHALAQTRIDGYSLDTERPPGIDDYIRGFIGSCSYSSARDAPLDVRRCINVLADYAFFAGVGVKTTMGMGQVICESHD